MLFAALGAPWNLAAVNQNSLSSVIPNLQPFQDPSGFVATYNVNGNIDTTNAFFQSLGTNGRSCGTCHLAGNAFGLSATSAQARFTSSGGTDPLFAPVDGANCSNAARSNPASHSLIINNGLIRVALQIPATASAPIQNISVVHDPYGCALVIDPNTGLKTVSVYRRPLPATNLNFLSAVMIDGRETVTPLNNGSTFRANLVTDLTHQALDATMGHAQASTPPSAAQLASIVNLEMGFTTAQVYDNSAGLLFFVHGAQGGPAYLASQSYYPGINDSLGKDPTGAAFNPLAFTIFAPWLNLAGNDDRTAAREAIANGEQIFNTFPLNITVVRGLNDNAALIDSDNDGDSSADKDNDGDGVPLQTIIGTCTSCHDTPNVGDHSFPLPLDIGTSHAAALESDANIAGGLAQLSAPDLPVYEIDGCPDPFNPGQTKTVYTSDPGKALLTGNCSDLNRIKGPVLRGLAARAPYFHNGAAATLDEVVEFYEKRFQFTLTDKQKQDLIAFLNSL